MSLKTPLTLLFCCLIHIWGFAQDKTFTQINATPLNLNPAFAGTNPLGRAMLAHRVQYPQFAGDFVTTYFSYDHAFPRHKSSLGFWAMADRAGAANFRSTNINISYSYLVPFQNDWRLKMGLEAGYGNKSLNYLNLIFGDQVSNTGVGSQPSQEALDGLSLNYADISSGFLLYNPYLWIGFSAAHLNQPNQTFLDMDYRLPVRYSVHGGMRLPLSIGNARKEEATLNPGFVYRTQGQISQLDLGSMLYYKNFSAGLWYRNIPIQESANGALALIAGAQFQGFRLSYAYEYALSELSRTGGSHELGLSFIFKYPRIIPRKRPVKYVAFPLFSEYGDDRY